MVVMLPAGIPPFMKATLEFTLPEEQHEHQDALRGYEWRAALTEVVDYLRNQIKHGENSADEFRAFERTRERISDILEEHGLDLYE